MDKTTLLKKCTDLAASLIYSYDEKEREKAGAQMFDMLVSPLLNVIEERDNELRGLRSAVARSDRERREAEEQGIRDAKRADTNAAELSRVSEELREMEARALSLVFHIPGDTLAGDIQKWRDEMLALRIRREALMDEAADSVHASLAEDGISDDRRAYRADLEKRLRAELAGGQQLFPNEILQVMPNGERWLYNVALNTWRQQTP